MNEQQTTILKDRLARLADEMTPQLDVVGLVRDARATHSRKRRGRIALLAAATATAAVVGGTVTSLDLLSATGDGQVADPGISTPTSSTPPPLTATAEPIPPSTSAGPSTTEPVPTDPAVLPDGEHFAVVYGFDPVTGQMDLEPARWLGEGRTWSCVPEPGPDEAVDDVTEYCVGERGARQTMQVAAAQLVLTPEGNPPYAASAEQFAAAVVELVDNPWQGPLMGWMTVENGAVVEFQQTPRQAA